MFTLLMVLLAGPTAQAQHFTEEAQALLQTGFQEARLPIPEAHAVLADLAAQLGRNLYRRDRAAARATEVLVASPGELLADPRMRGWLTLLAADGVTVVFMGEETDGALGVLYSVFVPTDGSEPTYPVRGEPYTERPETLSEVSDNLRLLWKARQTALASDWPATAPQYNVEVVQIDFPDGVNEFWVYLLGASFDPDQLVLGGHVVVYVAGDGEHVRSVLPTSQTGIIASRSALTAGQPEGHALAGTVLTNMLFDYPVDTQVFSSLTYDLPLLLVTRNNVWDIRGDDIRFLGDLTLPSPFQEEVDAMTADESAPEPKKKKKGKKKKD